jgi:hypothetical protein
MVLNPRYCQGSLQADSSVLGSNRGGRQDVFQTEAANRVRVSTAYSMIR